MKSINSKGIKAAITAVSGYLPSEVLSNSDLEKMVLHGPDFVCELLRDFRVSEAHLFALLYPNALSQLHEPLVFEGLKQHLRRPRARNTSANKGIGR